MFNEYPYVNLQDVNLDWILKHIKELETNLQDFIKLNTVKYADPIDWDISRQYEANTVVVDPFSGVAYLSTQPVPTGVNITNTDYWTAIFTLDFVNMNKNISMRNDGNNNIATFSSNVGDWLIVAGQLYKVIQDIPIGNNYIVGTNLQTYSVELFVKDYLNNILTYIGDLNNLNTSDKTSIVNAINSVLTDISAVIGDLNNLNTSDKTSVVNAINSVLNDINSVINVTIGDLDDLNTSDKTSVVNAINSVLTDTIDVLDERIVTPEMFGAIGDGLTDDTAAINACLSAGYHVISFKRGATYLINPLVSIIPQSKQIIDLNGCTLQAKTVSEDTYDVIKLDGVSNVLIKNGTIIGERTTHTGVGGEWGRAIKTYNACKDITISFVKICDCWGDGITLNDVDNAIVENCEIFNNRRQGVTVAKCNNVIIKNNFIHDMNGTAPEAGIDVEPDNPTKAYNVLLIGNIIKDCTIGISITDGQTPANVYNCKAINNTIIASGSGKILVKIYGTDLVVSDNMLIGDNISSFISCSGLTGNVIKNNVCKGTSVSDSIQLYTTNRSVISGNDIQVTSTDSIMLLYQSTNNVINDNVFHNTHGGSAYPLLSFRGVGGVNADNNKIHSNVFENVSARAVFGFNSANDNKISSNKIGGTYEAIDRGITTCTGDDFYYNVFVDGTVSTHIGGATGQYVQNIVNDVLVP